ncbi:hypothetical protein F0L74_28920 [Chitinophaga agrisoli]|uniref:Uncharacterized protein n=1 Tax=Chitinophaga agrisoli TaxID=2607653 RepID=A0A5B2VMC6_9BACT|nr:class I lanthipeptide [Chitinophaga agrisoli]KAA2240191.1 hypothetical protein F0L74_28920 [Chitinophaga agrisoli]
MKQQNDHKSRLSLNKQTVAKLDIQRMKQLRGGVNESSITVTSVMCLTLVTMVGLCDSQAA